MAIFRKKTSEAEAPEAADGGRGTAFEAQPEKARKWFDHAKTAAMSSNHAYALECYASGVRLDPELLSAHEAMYEVALQYATNGGKPASGREVKGFDDGSPVSKFAAAEFAWMKDINNAGLALRALEAAIKAEQMEFGNWSARMVLALLRRSKKPNKAQLIAGKDLFAQVGAWNEAIVAGEMALQLDPTDAELAAEMKDLAAQRAMDQGGYAEAAGEEGGFRKFVRDIDKQRELEEAEAISGASSIEERNLVRAKQAYEANPNSPDAVNRYAQILKKQDTPESVREAYELYLKGYKAVGEYRFRMAAGDIKIELARRKVRALREKMASNGETAEIRDQLETARQGQLDLEATEYRERVTKYPTDRTLKYQLGLVEFDLGDFDAAMECFQKAKDEPKLRVRAGHMLGRSFARKPWHAEAIAEYREALAAMDVVDEERELDIRYDLMLSLAAHAREESSPELAREARDICSSIARKDVSYRDIRDKRKQVDQLVQELS
ncbi:MAG: tetratricopeptide repeat protein [Planctomycetota bacterium]